VKGVGVRTPVGALGKDEAGHNILGGSGANLFGLEQIGNVRWRQIGLRIDGNEGEEEEAEDGGEESHSRVCEAVKRGERKLI
jgi:hypothetical protein